MGSGPGGRPLPMSWYLAARGRKGAVEGIPGPRRSIQIAARVLAKFAKFDAFQSPWELFKCDTMLDLVQARAECPGSAATVTTRWHGRRLDVSSAAWPPPGVGPRGSQAPLVDGGTR